MLTLNRYRVTLDSAGPLDLPAYLGSTLRGAFGHAFRRVACTTTDGPCPTPETCPYHLVFEARLPPGAPALRSFDEIPRPFVIAPAENANPQGRGVAFDLTLLGRARELFPYFVVALREVGSLGRGRRPVALAEIRTHPPLGGPPLRVFDACDNLVLSHDAAVSLDACRRLDPPRGEFAIRYLTCTRLKHEGRWAERPEFHVVFRRLLGRLSSLSLFHCSAPLDVDFTGLIEQARAVKLVRNQTRWRDWTRYSSQQDRRMVLGGLVGEARYEGPVAELWPFLTFGQWTHVGKNATFGLGRYELEPKIEDAA